MRAITPAAAAIIALGALLGGAGTAASADAPESVQQRIAAVAPSANTVVAVTRNNNGNG